MPTVAVRIPEVDNRNENSHEHKAISSNVVCGDLQNRGCMSNLRKEVIEVELLQNNTAKMILPINLKNGLRSRIDASRGFIRDACNWFQRNGYKKVKFAVQLHDDEPEVPAFIMDAPSSRKRSTLTLIPDFYCLGSQGYANLRKDFEKLPKWRERIPMSIWRGSTTGGGMLTK